MPSFTSQKNDASIAAARSWLANYQESYDPAAFVAGFSTPARGLRAV